MNSVICVADNQCGRVDRVASFCKMVDWAESNKQFMQGYTLNPLFNFYNQTERHYLLSINHIHESSWNTTRETVTAHKHSIATFVFNESY